MSKPAPTSVRKEMADVREKIAHHEYLYFVADDPQISDAAFDRLMNRLKQLEAAHPELRTPDSPTVRVGGTPRSGFQTVAHAPSHAQSRQCIFLRRFTRLGPPRSRGQRARGHRVHYGAQI